MDAITRYFTFILEDGDYLNDWLTHIPEMLQPFILVIGYIVALVLGG